MPLDLVAATDGGIRLQCTLAEFEQLEMAETTKFLPGRAGFGGYGPGQALLWPFYGLGGGVVGAGVGFGSGNVSGPVTLDKVPPGEVAIRRGEPVHARDGDIGRVQGLVIDSRDHHVTHVLLQEGHLWGRKDVAIPIGAVIAVDDGVRLTLTKQEVEDLPSVAVDHPEI